MSEINDMAKTYNPAEMEDRIYNNWVEKGYFTAHPDANKKPYSIVIPPPNITGQLHMGHALNNTLQDILVRWRRMQGYSTLWLPGTDHASIATEAKIVEAMAKEGIKKEDVTREEFLERAWEWKAVYGGRIVEQLKKLGSSCDWSRERFTLDEGLNKAVTEVFVNLYEKGLIYRGERIINWCTHCKTSISDAEVEYEEKPGHLWHIKYLDKEGNHVLTVATTRPETMLGDTAVAVNPDDERYKDLVGKTIILPLVNREIPVVADDYVTKEFGTGAVKITPAHDPNDFEIGLRHNLDVITVIDESGTMNENAGKYQGMDMYEARDRIVEDLEKIGQLEKTEDYVHNVGKCYRCGTTIEPMVSKQWFVKMKPLAEPAIKVVEDGEIKFIPDRFSKTYFNWMRNIQDWCISRQLWWGHRIPAYYCEECGEVMVSKTTVDKCTKCGSTHVHQDSDTLDTWFSSALWPFSTMGWPDKTEDLDYYYPTNVLVTAYDIIFFWVARMIFSGVEHMGEVPFNTVLIHGIVRDSQGRKMSKSLGNGIDPLEVIDKYGADALRFALANGTSPGNDQRFSDDKVEYARNFANKIWNASRFAMMNFDEGVDLSSTDESKFTDSDKWILASFNNVVKEVNENLEKFETGIALQKVYEFIWEEVCDWYIELIKPRLYDKDNETRQQAQYVLNYILIGSMKLLHPFMPFITEEIYDYLQHDPSEESIMISAFPEYDEKLGYEKETKNIETLIEAVRSIRNIRQSMNVPANRKAKVIFVSGDTGIREMIEKEANSFQRLAAVSELEVRSENVAISKSDVSAIIDNLEIYIPLEGLVDVDKEIARLEEEKENLEKEIQRASSKLANENFVSKAPQKVVDEEREKLQKYQDMYEKVKERAEEYSKLV